MAVAEVIRNAVRSCTAPDGFRIAPKSKLASSIIYSYGVRVQQTDGTRDYYWMCLASDQCRQAKFRVLLSKGKTSKATLHLKQKHGVISHKTEVVKSNQKRTRDIADAYKASALYQQNPARFVVVLETMNVVLNNQSFRSIDHLESVLLRQLCYKEEFQATLNPKVVNHTIYELYACAKDEITGVINSARMSTGSFSLVTDFWTSKVQSAKYIGVRLYMVDSEFRFRSILLATKPFNPHFGDRDRGIRFSFRQWILDILEDFKISPTDLFGSTTDAGSDVKWMMRNGFKLQWEWCIPHLSHAATKSACGLVDDPTKSKNPEMTTLIKKITKTAYQTDKVEVMGTLFEELCKALSTDSSTRLLDYRSHRFLGITRVIERILLKWDVLEAWYEARQDKAARDGTTPPPFPLEGQELDLIQILSLLKPITQINTAAQAEAPNQVKVLLDLFTLRMTTLNIEHELHDHRSLPLPAQQAYFQVRHLRPIVKKTRALLCSAFQKRFFKRYTDSQAIRQCSFIFEIQLALHPHYKDLDLSLRPLMVLCNQQLDSDTNVGDDDDHAFNFVTIAAHIKEKISELMRKFIPAPERVDVPRSADPHLQRFGRAAPQRDDVAHQDRRIRDEIMAWFSDVTALQQREDGKDECILAYWHRQQIIGRYTLLPLVARTVFAVPASSAQLERDFGVSGMHVTPQRARVGAKNVDRCAFINRNRAYVDITQCAALEPEENYSNANVPFDATQDINDNFDLDMPALFSNTTIADADDADDDSDDEELNTYA